MYHYLVFKTNNNLVTNNIGSYTIFNVPSYINEYNWKAYSNLEKYFCKILFDVKTILYQSDAFENIYIFTIDDVNEILKKKEYTVIHFLTEELEFSFLEQYYKPNKVLNLFEIINFYKNYKSSDNYKSSNKKVINEFNKELLDFNNEIYE
jgi:hypothetical protein